MNRGQVLLAAVVLLGVAVVAYQLWLLAGLYIGDICPPGPPGQDDGPAAWEVSALMEEARRITGEAS